MGLGLLRDRGRRATSDASEMEGLLDGRWLSPQLVGDGRAAYSAAAGLVEARWLSTHLVGARWLSPQLEEARWLSPHLVGARGAKVPLEGLGDCRGA